MSVRVIGDDPVLIRHLHDRLDRLPPLDRDLTISVSTDPPTEMVDLWLAPASASRGDPLGSAPSIEEGLEPGGEEPRFVDAASFLEVHDLYATGGSSAAWGGGVERLVAKAIDGGHGGAGSSPPEEAHWLHVRDLCDAVADLCTLSEMPTTMSIRGRRNWSYEEVSAEIDLLWSRFDAIRSGDPSAIIDAMHDGGARAGAISPRIEDAEKPEPADLGPLHSALRAANGQGFHPSVPMRVGLMEVIAAIVDGD